MSRFCDLASRGLFGQLVEQPDPAWIFVGGHPRLDVVAQLVWVDVLPFLQRDSSAVLFAQRIVRNAMTAASATAGSYWASSISRGYTL